MRVPVKTLLGQQLVVEAPDGGTVADLARRVAGSQGACRLFFRVRAPLARCAAARGQGFGTCGVSGS